MNIPVIDYKKCTKCGRCLYVCPHKVLVMEENMVRVTVDECMLCSHCYTVCPVDAVSFDESVLRHCRFSSFKHSEKMVQPGEFSSNDLLNLLKSRRSTRKYLEKDIPRNMLEDLISSAVYAPSGSNCQMWQFTCINGREKVWDFALKIKDFFVKLNRMAGNPVIRYLSFLVAGMAMIRYNRDHKDSVVRALEESEKGVDLLFHGAPAVIIIHGPMEGSTPVEDAQYAAYNICLMAHAMGLGTCFIGYAVEAMNRVRGLRQYCSIPANNRIHAVLIVGYPGVKMIRPALRMLHMVDYI